MMSQEISKRENIEIYVKNRQPGKGEARRLRRNQWIPSVLYGFNKKNKPFAIPALEATKYSSHQYDNNIFILKSEEDKELNEVQVLKKDVSLDPLTRSPLHMDFYAIDMNKPIRVNVELKFVGKTLGEKEGGVFNVMRRDVEIECLPADIPKSFPVDISHLTIDDVIHVSDIQFPKKMKLVTHPTETVGTVSVIKEESEEKASPQETGTTEAPTSPTTTTTLSSESQGDSSSKGASTSSKSPPKPSGPKK